MATAPTCCRTAMARSLTGIRSRPGSTTLAWGRNTAGCATTGRVTYVPILDDEALEAFQLTTKVEGIMPALEFGACHCVCGEDRAGDGQGPDHDRQPLRPGRQGRPHGREDARHGDLTMTTRIDRRFEKLKAEGRPALVTYFMGGDPGLRHLARHHEGAARGRQRRHRTWACRFPTRWPTARQSRRPVCAP